LRTAEFWRLAAGPVELGASVAVASPGTQVVEKTVTTSPFGAVLVNVWMTSLEVRGGLVVDDAGGTVEVVKVVSVAR
jgi:hypothetical protein